jgi:hypothetical protein
MLPCIFSYPGFPHTVHLYYCSSSFHPNFHSFSLFTCNVCISILTLSASALLLHNVFSPYLLPLSYYPISAPFLIPWVSSPSAFWPEIDLPTVLCLYYLTYAFLLCYPFFFLYLPLFLILLFPSFFLSHTQSFPFASCCSSLNRNNPSNYCNFPFLRVPSCHCKEHIITPSSCLIFLSFFLAYFIFLLS